MTDTEALLAAILADPSDDFPRLQYADILEEQGQGDRSEFIRCQVAVAVWSGSAGETVRYAGGTISGSEAGGMLARSQALLHKTRSCEWSGFPEELAGDGALWHFHRGFVSEIVCTWDAWAAHHAEILKCQPISRVTLTTWPESHDFEASRDYGVRLIYHGCDAWTPTSLGGFTHAENIIQASWPRITFELPHQLLIEIPPMPHYRMGVDLASGNDYTAFRQELDGQIIASMGIPSHLFNPNP